MNKDKMDKDNIKRIRKKAGLTQEELARIMCTTNQTVSRWERGLSAPSKIFEQILNNLDKVH